MDSLVVGGLPVASSQDCCAFAMACGLPAIEQMIVAGLKASGFFCDSQAATLVVIDAPCGFALEQLATLAHPQRRTIVVTNSPCPEYWEDLWDAQPAVLLASDCVHRELETALVRVARGERYRLTPQCTTHLTPQERAVLRHVAGGLQNDEIAKVLDISAKTVANRLTAVYNAIGVNDRVKASAYYWGRHDLIKQKLCNRK